MLIPRLFPLGQVTGKQGISIEQLSRDFAGGVLIITNFTSLALHFVEELAVIPGQ